LQWIPDGPARDSFRKVWTYAMEQAIRNVERMAWGLRHAGEKTADVKTSVDPIGNGPSIDEAAFMRP
jgi:hypothetical protein